MGWSANRDACLTLDAITQKCIADTGSSNVFMDDRGNKFMFEVGREQHDGAICATCHKFLPDGKHCKPTTGLRIEPDGKISRGLSVLKKIRVLIFECDGFRYNWETNNWGEPTEDNVAKQLQLTNDSYKSGGLNHHASVALGHQKVVSEARIVDLDGNVVASHKHGMFQVV